jgi:hypothetical protein
MNRNSPMGETPLFEGEGRNRDKRERYIPVYACRPQSGDIARGQETQLATSEGGPGGEV